MPYILLCTKNDKHKERVFRGPEHKCAYLYPDVGTNNGHKRLDLNKYINLGAIKKEKKRKKRKVKKKSRVRFLRVTPHDL